MTRAELEVYMLEKMNEIEATVNTYIKDNNIDIEKEGFKFITMLITLSGDFKNAYVWSDIEEKPYEERYLFEVYVGGKKDEE